MPSILVVEDSITQSTQIRLMLKSAEFEVFVAENGREALEVLENHQPNIVLTDLQMPEMDGLELVEAIRDLYPHLPVVLMTQHGSEQIALDALRQGATSYLPKNELNHHMLDTLDDILESARLAHRQEFIQQRRFRTEIQYRLENDPAIIAPLAAQVEQELEDQNFGNPAVRRQIGVALRKALDNAIFHGNLELGDEDRVEGELVYRDLAEQRRTQPPWNERCVWVTIIMDEAEARFLVRDEGPGFDVSTLTESSEEANLDELRGSGLLLIRTFMDGVEHNALGNEITMIKRRPVLEDDDPLPRTGEVFDQKNNRVFELEVVEETLVLTLTSEKVGFADIQLPVDLNEVFRHIEHPGIQHVLVDFSQVKFFSSAVLEALRNIWVHLKDQGGQMAVCCLSDGGREILNLTKFNLIWPAHSSRTEALMALHTR